MGIESTDDQGDSGGDGRMFFWGLEINSKNFQQGPCGYKVLINRVFLAFMRSRGKKSR